MTSPFPSLAQVYKSVLAVGYVKGKYENFRVAGDYTILARVADEQQTYVTMHRTKHVPSQNHYTLLPWQINASRGVQAFARLFETGMIKAITSTSEPNKDVTKLEVMFVRMEFLLVKNLVIVFEYDRLVIPIVNTEKIELTTSALESLEMHLFNLEAI
jgi:hypothetical protein